MATTLIGIFDDYAEAQAAVEQLTAIGLRQGEISIVRNEPVGKSYTVYGGANSKDYTTGTSVGSSLTDFFENLFGGDDAARADTEIYAESVRRGSVVVAATVEDAMAERAADVLNRSGAIDVDRRAAYYRNSGFRSYDASAPLYTSEQTQTDRKMFAEQGEIALPVIEEQLNVGKRVVQRGGVRVHTHIVERPVQEQINLRQEHIRVERHAVNRAATDADFASIREGEITLTERTEVPVVAKEARVVEEISIGKDVTERVETVSDTIRRTDVQVEEINTNVDANRTTSGKR